MCVSSAAVLSLIEAMAREGSFGGIGGEASLGRFIYVSCFLFDSYAIPMTVPSFSMALPLLCHIISSFANFELGLRDFRGVSQPWCCDAGFYRWFILCNCHSESVVRTV